VENNDDDWLGGGKLFVIKWRNEVKSEPEDSLEILRRRIMIDD